LCSSAATGDDDAEAHLLNENLRLNDDLREADQLL
jgi:hypothetical protein